MLRWPFLLTTISYNFQTDKTAHWVYSSPYLHLISGIKHNSCITTTVKK